VRRNISTRRFSSRPQKVSLGMLLIVEPDYRGMSLKGAEVVAEAVEVTGAPDNKSLPLWPVR
jgi:hypothetical protein